MIQRRRAFTLIELLVVISIIGLLASMVLASVTSAREKARLARALQFEASIYSMLGDDLIVNYTFDELTTAVSNPVPINETILATQGFGPNAIAVNQPVVVEGINGGKALDFDGTNDSVEVAGVMQESPTESFTLSIWVKPESGATRYLIGQNDDISNKGWSVRTLSNGNVAYVYDHSYATRTTTNQPLRIGEWNHILVNVDIPATTVTIYVNGEEAPLDGSVINSYKFGNPTLTIGSDRLGRFAGVIDNVRIYSRTFE